MRTYKSLYIISLFVLIFSFGFSCEKELLDTSVKASFSFTPMEAHIGDTIIFTDGSFSRDRNFTFFWDFGDGNTSSVANPNHVYGIAGSFNITLFVANSTNSDSITKTIVVIGEDSIPGVRLSLSQKIALDDKVLVCAHRAYHKNAPENSISAIQAAIDLGIDFVEIDVRQTYDGELILMHDTSIDRTTNGSGKVSSLTIEEIRSFFLLNVNGSISTEKVPTLGEVLTLSKGNIYLDLDLKSATISDLYNEVQKYDMLSEAMVVTKNYDIVNYLLSKDKILYPMANIENGVNEGYMESYSGMYMPLVEFWYSGFNNSSVRNQIKTEGWKTFVNIYINDTGDPVSDNYFKINYVVDRGAKVIQTDYPEEIKNYISQFEI